MILSLASKGISSFLHNRRHKSLCRAVNAMKTNVDIQHNRLIHLEDSMVMYGVYNAETLLLDVKKYLQVNLAQPLLGMLIKIEFITME